MWSHLKFQLDVLLKLHFRRNRGFESVCPLLFKELEIKDMLGRRVILSWEKRSWIDFTSYDVLLSGILEWKLRIVWLDTKFYHHRFGWEGGRVTHDWRGEEKGWKKRKRKKRSLEGEDGDVRWGREEDESVKKEEMNRKKYKILEGIDSIRQKCAGKHKEA